MSLWQRHNYIECKNQSTRVLVLARELTFDFINGFIFQSSKSINEHGFVNTSEERKRTLQVYFRPELNHLSLEFQQYPRVLTYPKIYFIISHTLINTQQETQESKIQFSEINLFIKLFFADFYNSDKEGNKCFKIEKR